MKHPAGVLMKPQGSPPPVELGTLTLPPQKDLSCLAVNPYKVDSWPIEPNSRGGRASGDLAVPPLRECEEESEPDETGDDWSDAPEAYGPEVHMVDRPEGLPMPLEEDPPTGFSPAPAPTGLPAPLQTGDGSPPPRIDGGSSEGGSPSLNAKVVRLPPLSLGGAGNAIA